LAAVRNTDRKGIYLSLYSLVSEEEKNRLHALISRRIKGEPVAYLVGKKEFWSLNLKVTPAVMIPRPETETLVEAALPISSFSPFILELGTGSGAIAIALAKESPQALIIATDISIAALRVAKENAFSHRINSIRFIAGDLFSPFKLEKVMFDLIITNPPYIPSSQISQLPAGIRDYEPRIAFDGGEDGLAVHRKIIQEAPCYLKVGGYLLLEVGEGQSKEVAKIISATPKFSSPEIIKDLAGLERVVKACRI